MKINQVMHAGVDWVSPETPLSAIAKVMRDHDIGAVPVGEKDKLVGMITDRDIVCRALAEGRDISKLKARDVMTKGIVYCRTDEDVEDAIHLMEQKQIRRLPVIDKNKRMVGMLSLGDISHRVGHELSGELAEAVTAHHGGLL
ncbi:CBS domain-containing protein [Pseudokordiimonas caeni]|uniref:CBS domain-containing protein n=1 Tax=Pseudokordiimonas caeni TaxID=2997908 RepID=UPI0028125C33|nr:CBS domain-containing protein [Pseudokordiimonas caeni]